MVLGLETRWRPILKLLGPKLAKQTHVSSPSTACCLVLKLWCEAFMHTVSAQKLFADTQKKRHASKSKPRRHTVCTEEIAETSTPFRKLAGAQKRPSRFRWNLLPRLIDTCRIRISNPLKNSSAKKAKKIAPYSCEIHSTSSTRPILTKRTTAERARSAFQALQTTWSCGNDQLSGPLSRNTTQLVPSQCIRCYPGGATKGKGSWRHRPRSLGITEWTSEDWRDIRNRSPRHRHQYDQQ